MKKNISTNFRHQIFFRNQRYSDGKQWKQLEKIVNARE